MNTLWHPYTQMKTAPPPYEIASAKGVYLKIKNGPRLIDAIASWWCVIHGYNHPKLNKAVTAQLKKMAHIMLGGLTHEPAQTLADKLVQITPAGLNHVFFSDSGSVGVEIALKMALQYWQNKNQPEKNKFIAFKKAYHGDTFGAMAVCDPQEGMHRRFGSMLAKHIFLPAPDMGLNPDPKKLQRAVTHLDHALKKHAHHLAGCIIEPIVQAAGGFNFYAPEYLTALRRLCSKYNVLLITDEVATGFGRTGKLFACEHAEITPDIMILGKGLTAGYMGHAATLSTSEVFNAFYQDNSEAALMHGPTFMANPIACAVALKSIEIFKNKHYLKKIKKIETQLKKELSGIKSKSIKSHRILGAIGVIEVFDPKTLIGLQEFAFKHGVWLRPFGAYAYIMPSYTIAKKELNKITATLKKFFSH